MGPRRGTTARMSFGRTRAVTVRRRLCRGFSGAASPPVDLHALAGRATIAGRTGNMIGVAQNLTLIVNEGGKETARLPLVGPRLIIGRKPDVDVRVQDIATSGHHAEVLIDEAGVRLRDLGSRNGT